MKFLGKYDLNTSFFNLVRSSFDTKKINIKK